MEKSKRTLIIINFSHPLTQEVMNQILQSENESITYKYTDIEQQLIPCHIDLDKPIQPQIESLALLVLQTTPENIIIPPALGVVAFLLARYFGYAKIAWLKRDGDAMPPKWVLGGIE